VIKAMYKPSSMLCGVPGGIIAAAVFKWIWKMAAGEDKAPQVTEAGRTWREVLTAAALQGAIFGLVRPPSTRPPPEACTN
jgi:hypothetical protein